MNQYYYRDKAGVEIGPLTLDVLAKLRFVGVLDGDTPVRSSDSTEWKPCREIIADLPQAGSSATPVSVPAVSGKSGVWQHGWSLFALAVLCFLLPFIDVSCKGTKVTFTGQQLVTGTDLQQNDAWTGQKQTKRINPYPAAQYALGLGVAAFLLSLARKRTTSLLSGLVGAGGVAGLFVLKSTFENEITAQGQGLVTLNIREGFWLAGILLVGGAITQFKFFNEAPVTASALQWKDWRVPKRYRLALVVLAIGLGVACGGATLYKSLSDKATLSFDLSLDGKPLPVAARPNVQVDGKPLRPAQGASGWSATTLGHHKLSVQLENAEPIERTFWVFFGNKVLGTLPLDSSKGSLSVTVNPIPATVTVKREGEVVREGNAPFQVDKLPVGEYQLLARRGDYEERSSAKIERQRQTEVNIILNLGSVQLSAQPPDAEFELSGNGRHWQGKLPIRIDDMPVGTYQLITRRGQYEESSAVNIERQQQTETNIKLNLGSAKLSSDPPDAEFELSGNGRHWQGKLPVAIADIPAGDYTLAATRKGWEQTDKISINRGSITTNKMEFHYGSLEVTSDPTGLAVSTNGSEIGKTPITVRELRPGRYILTAMDGDNDLTAEIPVAPREAAKHTFLFHYGTVQLASIPTDATVIHKGKEIGKTPLTLNHMPAGETIVELRLKDYASTNFSITAVEGATNQLSAQLVSERYLQAMNQARETFGAGQFAQSREFLATALVIQPDDPAATQLRDEVAKAAAKAEEAMQAEQANAKARDLASLRSLDFGTMIGECTDTRTVQHPIVMNDGYYDKKGNFIATGQHTGMQNTTESTFNEAKFVAQYSGRTYKCDFTGWKIAKIEKDGTVAFRRGSGKLLGFGQVEIRATPSAASQGEFLSLKDSPRITIRARIGRHDQGDLFSRVLHRIYLEDAELLTQ